MVHRLPPSDQIGRITRAGGVTTYGLPEPGSRPYQILTGPDGAIWFTEINGSRIGRLRLVPEH